MLDKLKQYIKTQKDLRIEAEKEISKRTTTNIRTVINKGGVVSR